jgi:hypothetical protein
MTKQPSIVQTVLESPFQLESLDETTAPEGSEGSWYRYVISQGTNTITGTRSGSRAEVTALLHEMVQRLNERRGKFLAKQR